MSFPLIIILYLSSDNILAAAISNTNDVDWLNKCSLEKMYEKKGKGYRK